MNTTHPNYQFQDRLGQPVEIWCFARNGSIRQVTSTAFPQWTTKEEVDFDKKESCLDLDYEICFKCERMYPTSTFVEVNDEYMCTSCYAGMCDYAFETQRGDK